MRWGNQGRGNSPRVTNVGYLIGEKVELQQYMDIMVQVSEGIGLVSSYHYKVRDSISISPNVTNEVVYVLGHNDYDNIATLRVVATINSSYFKESKVSNSITPVINIYDTVTHWVCPQDYVYNENISIDNKVVSEANYFRYYKIYDYIQYITLNILEDLPNTLETIILTDNILEYKEFITVSLGKEWYNE